MAEFRLETERLILRDWQSGDFEALHALCTCPQVMATIGPLHDEEKTRGLLGRLQERTQLHGHTFWAMERKDDGRVIGFCGVSRGPVPPIAGARATPARRRRRRCGGLPPTGRANRSARSPRPAMSAAAG